jgi:dihydrofolate reductase
MSQTGEENMRKIPHPRISIIAAIGQNGELGKNGELIWRISDDLKRVKSLTMGHPLIMGRKTYESIGRPLPGRTNIVISQTIKTIDGCVVVDTLEGAIDVARTIDRDEIFIFGGAQVYTKALPRTDRLYLTVVNAEDNTADTFFPSYKNIFTHTVPGSREKRTDQGTGLAYEWITLERP